MHTRDSDFDNENLVRRADLVFMTWGNDERKTKK